MLINVKMPTIVGILTFLSKIYILCTAELSMKKSFIIWRPESLCCVNKQGTLFVCVIYIYIYIYIYIGTTQENDKNVDM